MKPKVDLANGILKFKGENKMINTELVGILREKIDREWENYNKRLLELDKNTIISKSYEISVKENFHDVLFYEAHKNLSDKEIGKLLKMDGILDKMYYDWTGYEDDINETYDEFIFDFWKKKNLQTEKYVIKMQHVVEVVVEGKSEEEVMEWASNTTPKEAVELAEGKSLISEEYYDAIVREAEDYEKAIKIKGV